jgi:hypothetical protein
MKTMGAEKSAGNLSGILGMLGILIEFAEM